MPMPSAAKLIRFLLRYTDADTSASSASENMKNNSHAVFGHATHRSFSLLTHTHAVPYKHSAIEY